MPRAATTWVTTGMLRAMARQKEGLKRMHWLAEMIINAAPPRATWPLFHEGKLMGLDKLSGHGRNSDAGRRVVRGAGARIVRGVRGVHEGMPRAGVDMQAFEDSAVSRLLSWRGAGGGRWVRHHGVQP
eukprot:COSAG03_NODE_11_length_23018_cov_29.686461_23_plen_128_part_00